MDENKKVLAVDQLKIVNGGDEGISQSIDGSPNATPSGNSSQSGAFGIIKCPKCGEENKLEYLGYTGEGHRFRCNTCQTEFTR